LAKPAPPAGPESRSGFKRTAGAIRTILPVIQKVLPLLDGNIASAVSNILARPDAARVDLAPVESALARIRTEHVQLRGQVADQNSALSRITDKLEKIKDATERNEAEQKELMRDLHRLRTKVSVIAWVGLGLLAISVAANVFLFLRLER
jgi:septal ring factor EnvC (AmiA/AmiB activator)